METPLLSHPGPAAAGKPVKSEKGRLSGADGFRAIACLAVFIHHLLLLHARSLSDRAGWIGDLFRAGNVGVAAFFVLSGFLLSMPFWKARRTDKPMPSLRVYAMRRLGRIVPGYVLCLVLVWLITAGYAAPGGMFQLATSLTFTNSLFASTYFPPFDPPLWSVSIEMLFYVMLPLFAVGMFRLRSARAVRVYALAVIAGILAFQVLLNHAAPHLQKAIGHAAIFNAGAEATSQSAVLLFTHFLMGVLAADVYLAISDQKGGGSMARGVWRWYDSTAVGIMLLLVVLFAGVDQRIPLFWRVWWPPLSVFHWPLLHILFGAMLVCLAMSGRIGRWMDNIFLEWTANLSFGIYMWHVPVLRWVAKSWPRPVDRDWPNALLFGLAALVITYAIAAGSYYAIELPVLKRVHQRSKP